MQRLDHQHLPLLKPGSKLSCARSFVALDIITLFMMLMSSIPRDTPFQTGGLSRLQRPAASS
jgi:hypothetical protein